MKKNTNPQSYIPRISLKRNRQNLLISLMCMVIMTRVLRSLLLAGLHLPPQFLVVRLLTSLRRHPQPQVMWMTSGPLRQDTALALDIPFKTRAAFLSTSQSHWSYKLVPVESSFDLRSGVH